MTTFQDLIYFKAGLVKRKKEHQFILTSTKLQSVKDKMWARVNELDYVLSQLTKIISKEEKRIFKKPTGKKRGRPRKYSLAESEINKENLL